MRTFSCPKCEGERIKIEWIINLEKRGGRLQIVCETCGYPWAEPCSDDKDYIKQLDAKKPTIRFIPREENP